VNDPIRFLRILIDTPSLPGNETQVGDIVAAWLKARSWMIEWQPVTPTTQNVFAYRGTRNPRSELPAPFQRKHPANPFPPRFRMLILLRLDALPPFIASSEDEINVYGTGATDSKGVLIAMLFAVQQMIDTRAVADNDVAFLFLTAGTPVYPGIRRAKDLGLSAKFVLAGHPTQQKLGLG